MIGKLLEKIGLTSKITRKELEKFIETHRDSGLTLDIGCGHFIPSFTKIDKIFRPIAKFLDKIFIKPQRTTTPGYIVYLIKYPYP